MTQLKLLSPVKPEANLSVTGHYDQTTGLLNVSGTDNVDGIVKFEVRAYQFLSSCVNSVFD